MKKFTWILASGLVYVSVVASMANSTGLLITEIMFNPDGSDSDYEWIECYNPHEHTVRLDDYRFREGGVNHHIGDITVPAKGFVIIAQNRTSFLNRYPGLASITVDSSFSLSNSGELISLLSGNSYPDDLVDQITYTTTNEGGVVTGHSLHLAIRTEPTSADSNDNAINWAFSANSDKVSSSFGNDVANPGTALWVTDPDRRKSGFVFQLK